MTNYHEFILIAASDQTWFFVEISHPTKKIPIQGIKNPRDILKVKNPESRGFSGYFNRDLFELFKSRSRFPGFRDFSDFSLGIFSGLSEFFDLAGN